MNKTNELIINSISPLFIGSGNKIPAYNYILNQNNKFTYFDIDDILENLNENEKKIILEEQNLLKLRKKLVSNKKINEISKYSLKTDTKFQQKYTYEIGKNDSTNQLTVNEFINHNGYFYLPGSSIKGAFETALGIENAKEFGNFLMVRDSGNISENIVISGLKMRAGQNKAKGKNDINNFYQMIDKNQEITTNIVFRDYFNKDIQGKYNFLWNKDDFIEKINQYYIKKIQQFYLQLEQFINLLQNENNKHRSFENKQKELESIKEFIETYLKKEQENLEKNEFLLNLGFGGGFWWKSFEHTKHPSWNKIRNEFRNGEYKKIQIPRTYWKIYQNMLFGWVKCKLI